MAAVDSLLDTAYRLANETADAAIAASNYAIDAAYDWPPIVETPDLSYDDPTNPNFVTSYTVYSNPYRDPGDAEAFTPTGDITVPLTPEFPTEPAIPTPVLTAISPDGEKPVLEANPPEIDTGMFDWDEVKEPDIVEHIAPVLKEIRLSSPPTITIPAFACDYSPANIGNPTDASQIYKQEYATIAPEMRGFVDDSISRWVAEYAPELESGLAALEEKIATDIEGGRGLADEFETELYTRARTRAEQERVRVEQEILGGMAKRGFVLPMGAVSAGLQNAHQDSANNLATQATEISIERAKMELQHVQFVMNLSSGIRQFLISSALQYGNLVVTVNGQAMQYAKEVAELVTKVYDQLLEKAKLEINLCQVKAQVYEAELKGHLARLDVYKLEVEVAKTNAEIQIAEVKAYTEMVKAEQAKVELYVAQIEAIAQQVKVEQLKVEIYKSQIDAFQAEMQTVLTEAKIYQIQVGAYAEEVKAAQVEADIYKSKAEVVASRARASVAISEASIAKYKAEADGYRSRLEWFRYRADKSQANADTYLKTMSLNEESKSRSNDALAKKFEAEYKASIGYLEAQKYTVDSRLKADVANLNAYVSSTNLLATTAGNTATIYANMAAAALSSQNTMVSSVTTTSE